ncbi:ATP-binding protein, partial [bacterium]|nr:ATP-binding protein [bacterium]
MSNYNQNQTTPPAEGERRAVSGYQGQYRIAARIILYSLRRRILEWIRVADPSAGRVDDLQVGCQNRVDGYQVKWGQFSGNFTFNNLTKAFSNKPSLIAQLSDGWKRLRKKFPSIRVVVHLITNDRPSLHDRLPIGSKPATSNNFSSFLEQAWKVAKKADYPSKAVPDTWLTAWEALREASDLNEDDFDSFVKNCELEFDYRLSIASEDDRETTEIIQDIRHIAHVLFDTVADPSRIIKLNREKLLDRLGWGDRAKFRSAHDFPVDECLYNPISVTVEKLENAIENLQGGYIALLGSPGSGKSTLLTQTLRYRKSERVIKYYAYIPESQDPTTLRGESENFLHDVVLAIEKTGFRVGESMNMFDRDQLLKRFHIQLEKLHRDWQKNDRKTIILIDGLDHIEREQHPNRSLLLDLPESDKVPDGVYIILGSQTDNLNIPSSVQNRIRQRGRRIEMQTLNRKAVFDIIDKVDFKIAIKISHKDKIFELCGGHPLALRLLINKLQESRSHKAFEDVLSETEVFKGDIESYYFSFWRQIDNAQ